MTQHRMTYDCLAQRLLKQEHWVIALPVARYRCARTSLTPRTIIALSRHHRRHVLTVTSRERHWEEEECTRLRHSQDISVTPRWDNVCSSCWTLGTVLPLSNQSSPTSFERSYCGFCLSSCQYFFPLDPLKLYDFWRATSTSMVDRARFTLVEILIGNCSKILHLFMEATWTIESCRACVQRVPGKGSVSLLQ